MKVIFEKEQVRQSLVIAEIRRANQGFDHNSPCALKSLRSLAQTTRRAIFYLPITVLPFPAGEQPDDKFHATNYTVFRELFYKEFASTRAARGAMATKFAAKGPGQTLIT